MNGVSEARILPNFYTADPKKAWIKVAWKWSVQFLPTQISEIVIGSPDYVILKYPLEDIIFKEEWSSEHRVKWVILWCLLMLGQKMVLNKGKKWDVICILVLQELLCTLILAGSIPMVIWSNIKMIYQMFLGMEETK